MIMVKVSLDESYSLHAFMASQGFEPGTIWWETEDYNS
jgi:hypothetical protein